MLRSLGSVLCVVVMAAFVFGCGGGGGTSQMTDMTDPPPDTTTPPAEPTDADRIANAQQMIKGILTAARAHALAASSAASAIQTNTDATPDQIARAASHSTEAKAALSAIVSADNAAKNAATTTTLAEAKAALLDAGTAQIDLNTARSAITTIQNALQAVADAREQRARDEIAQTGGSSLIKHLSENKKVSDAVLAALAPASLLVGETGGTTGTATYPYHKGTLSTQYPRPTNTDRGVLGVMVSVDGTNESSHSQTGKISGTGRLSNGFDVEDGDGRFATVYTDITVDKRVRQKEGNRDVDDAVENNDATMDIDERYKYIADTDYLLAGIWLDDTTGSPVLRAFAFGSQPIADALDFCTAADVTNTATLMRACGNAGGRKFNEITGFVDENESEEATYRGGVNGAYFAGGKASHFKANVSLTAQFVRGSGTDIEGSKISGEITSINAGGNSITGSIDLKEQALGNDISGAFDAGEAAGVIEGHAYTGAWKGQFFGMRARRMVADNDRLTTTTYTPDKPNSVAGSFYVDRETVGEGEAAFIGAFGANR